MEEEIAKAFLEMAANKKIDIKVLASIALDYCEHLENPEVVEERRRLSVLLNEIEQC